ERIVTQQETEIADPDGPPGPPFAACVVHAEYRLVDDEKMPKSLGNTYTVPDVVAKGFRPSAVRYLLLSVHYRKRLNFTWASLASAEESLRRLIDFLARTEAVTLDQRFEAVAERVQEARTAFADALRDDLNTAAALGAMFELV